MSPSRATRQKHSLADAYGLLKTDAAGFFGGREVRAWILRPLPPQPNSKCGTVPSWKDALALAKHAIMKMSKLPFAPAGTQDGLAPTPMRIAARWRADACNLSRVASDARCAASAGCETRPMTDGVTGPCDATWPT